MSLMRQQQGMASARLKLKTLNDNPYIDSIMCRRKIRYTHLWPKRSLDKTILFGISVDYFPTIGEIMTLQPKTAKIREYVFPRQV